MNGELGASVPAHWRLSVRHSSVFSCSALTPKVTEEEWELRAESWEEGNGAAQADSFVEP